MRRLVLLVMAALVVPAMADALQVGSVVKVLDNGANSRGILVYDDTSFPTNYAFSQPPGTVIGDELLLDFSQAPPNYTTLDDLSFSVGTFSAVPLDYADIDIDIFNYNPDTGLWDPAGSISQPGMQFGGLEAGYFSTFTLNNLSSLNIVLTDDILVTITATNVNPGVTDVGQLIYDPPTIGQSGDYFYMNGGWYWFGGSPVANFYWAVGVIPEPGSLLLLALGGLTLARRR